jgi:hypothetical protein
MAAGLALAITIACGNSTTKSVGSGSGDGSGGGPPPPPPVQKPPVVSGDFTFWSTPQGLSATVNDVSADEGGNVYVAAGDAVFAKRRADSTFSRFDASNASLTPNCFPPADISTASPAGAPAVCPIISVAGATAGRAVIGFQGVGTDSDKDATWALDSGGADVVTFDGAKMARERHVFVASPPGVVCETQYVYDAQGEITGCMNPWLGDTWTTGRKKMRQIHRVVVNHDSSRPLSYGDVFFSGTHGTIAILVAHPSDRGWIDTTNGDPAWADARYVFEHEHPACTWPADGRFLTGTGHALAIDPTTNVPWFANQFKTASLPDYATERHPTSHAWWGPMTPPNPFIAWWEPEGNPDDATLRDNVESLSFCDDGTLWIASSVHGLARRAPDGSVSYVDLPAGTGNSALAVACDPSDSSVWVGFGWGGFGRLRGGQWSGLAALVGTSAPAFVANPVRSIQIDRWSSPRIVYFAHVPSRSGPGGVTAYAGP